MFCRFIIRASEYFKSAEESIYFFDQIQENKLRSEEARLICELKKGMFILEQGKLEQVSEILNSVKQKVRFAANLDSIVYSNLYKLSYLYQ